MAGTISFTMDAQMAGFVRSCQKAYDKVKNVEGGVKSLTQATGRAATEIDKTGQALDKKAAAAERAKKGTGELTSQLSTMLGPAAAATAAVGLLSGAIRGLQTEYDKLGESMRGREEGLKLLSQVSATPGATAEQVRERFAFLENLAQQISVREGIDFNPAARLVFQAKSQGLLGDIGVLSKTGRFTDAQAMIESVGKFQAAFGRPEVGGAEQLVSKFLAAAGESDISVEEIARAAVIAAQGAKRIGGTDEELLGLVSVLAPAFKSPQIAAQRLQALSTMILRGGYTRGGFLGGLRRYAAEKPEEFEAALIAQQEAGGAFAAIQTNLPAIGARIGEISAAQQTLDPLKQQWAITESGTMARLRRERRQRMAGEVTGEPRGEEVIDFETNLAQLRELGRRTGKETSAYLGEKAYRVERFLDALTDTFRFEAIFGKVDPGQSAEARLERNLAAARDKGLLPTEGGTSADAVLIQLQQRQVELLEQQTNGALYDLRPMRADDRE